MRPRTAVGPTTTALLGLAAATIGVGACTAGSGSGTADGTMMVIGCNGQNSLATPKPYALDPTFFAGEPFEDICPPMLTCSGPHTNRLVIRMQRNGNSIEVNDTLYFDVQSSYEVARCLRGRILPGGAPDWDTRLVTDADGAAIPGLVWCDWTWSASADGGAADAGLDASGAVAPPDAGGMVDGGAQPASMTAPSARINISTQDFVQVSFSPMYTCSSARLVAVALPGSWIQFENFGTAAEPTLDAGARAPMADDFKVNFGDRLRATFHLVMGDQRVEQAIMSRLAIPQAKIGGELDGSFDFDLERGRAAQPFP